MSVELVTGYYGVDEGGEPKRHVSSAEDGARQAGTLGLGCYALSTGSKLSATMEDANTLVVADGDVVMNGRHVSLPDPTSFTIPTGVQGQKVSNLAVLRYQKAADSVESVTPLVLTGEPSADTPIDPDYNDGNILDGDSPVDMPLYRVVTDGINAGDPVPLFDVVMPMSELWDSVSQVLWEGSTTTFNMTFPGISGKKYLLFDFAIDGEYSGTGVCHVAQGASEACALSMAGQALRISRIAFRLSGDVLSCSSGNINYSSMTFKFGQPLVFAAGTFAQVTRIIAV